MKYKPHNYQQHATKFITQHPEAALLLQMGLGKTIITLTALAQLKQTNQLGQTLIIAPLRVARDTWPTELKKWDHLQNLTHTLLMGSPTQRTELQQQPTDIHIINRENLTWLTKHCGKHWPYTTVVIDELSSFKSHTSQRFKALRKVRPQIHRIIGLTGTPAPNSLLDLWAPMRLIDQGQRLGQHVTAYRQKYFHPTIWAAGRPVGWELNEGADEAIYTQIKDITLSMRTTDYLDLPELTYSTREVVLAPKARAAYNQLLRDYIAELDGQTLVAGDAAQVANKLLQLAGGAIYNEDGETIEVHEAKLDALEDIIEAANGQTVLVAYWFKHELDRLTARFPQGRPLSTGDDMADWCAGRIPVGFIHPASAGHGLNLQSGGHILVWYTTPWSLELYEQTNARLFRQGQTEPVSVIHIAATNTIDQQVHDALQRKDVTQSALIHAVKAQLT